ncbi:MAG: hypothetical protein SGPRY_007360, partial [Prymnesium sp.]
VPSGGNAARQIASPSRDGDLAAHALLALQGIPSLTFYRHPLPRSPRAVVSAVSPRSLDGLTLLPAVGCHTRSLSSPTLSLALQAVSSSATCAARLEALADALVAPEAGHGSTAFSFGLLLKSQLQRHTEGLRALQRMLTGEGIGRGRGGRALQRMSPGLGREEGGGGGDGARGGVVDAEWDEVEGGAEGARAGGGGAHSRSPSLLGVLCHSRRIRLEQRALADFVFQLGSLPPGGFTGPAGLPTGVGLIDALHSRLVGRGGESPGIGREALCRMLGAAMAPWLRWLRACVFVGGRTADGEFGTTTPSGGLLPTLPSFAAPLVHVLPECVASLRLLRASERFELLEMGYPADTAPWLELAWSEEGMVRVERFWAAHHWLQSEQLRRMRLGYLGERLQASEAGGVGLVRQRRAAMQLQLEAAARREEGVNVKRGQQAMQREMLNAQLEQRAEARLAAEAAEAREVERERGREEERRRMIARARRHLIARYEQRMEMLRRKWENPTPLGRVWMRGGRGEEAEVGEGVRMVEGDRWMDGGRGEGREGGREGQGRRMEDVGGREEGGDAPKASQPLPLAAERPPSQPPSTQPMRGSLAAGSLPVEGAWHSQLSVSHLRAALRSAGVPLPVFDGPPVFSVLVSLCEEHGIAPLELSSREPRGGVQVSGETEGREPRRAGEREAAGETDRSEFRRVGECETAGGTYRQESATADGADRMAGGGKASSSDRMDGADVAGEDVTEDGAIVQGGPERDTPAWGSKGSEYLAGKEAIEGGHNAAWVRGKRVSSPSARGNVNALGLNKDLDDDPTPHKHPHLNMAMDDADDHPRHPNQSSYHFNDPHGGQSSRWRAPAARQAVRDSPPPLAVPTEAVLRACVIQPIIQAHSWLGRAAVLTVLEEYKLREYLHTLRRLLLGADAEFASQIVSALTRPNPAPAELALDLALSLFVGSPDGLPPGFTGLRLESHSAIAPSVEFEQMRLHIPILPPLDSIVDAHTVERYNQSFLPPCDLVIGARRLQVHDLVRLVSGLEAYFITFICEDCWVNLQRQIDLADSVMALRAAHEQYISAVCRHCLLDSEELNVSRRISAVFDLVHTLRHESEKPGWEQFAEISRHQFALQMDPLLQVMPHLANVCVRSMHTAGVDAKQYDDNEDMGHD